MAERWPILEVHMMKPTRDTELENERAMELQRPLEQVPTQLAITAQALPSFETVLEAVASGQISPEGLAKILDVYRALKTDVAEQEYNTAFRAFQEECPTIPRKSTAKIPTRKGTGGFSYDYADVETIMRTIGPVLSKHGLSVSFDAADYNPTTKILTATCRCSHIGGHSRTSSFPVTTETDAGMSAQQKFGAAATYAQRRALSAGLGLWTGDPDHDGGEPPPPREPPKRLTEEQADRITELVQEVGQDWNKLLAWWGIPNFDEACDDKYEAAIRFLRQKKQQQQQQTNHDSP